MQTSPSPTPTGRWALFLLAILVAAPTVQAQEGAATPHWVWHTKGERGSYPAETRYFRKTFFVKEPSRLVVDATADNRFTLYLDGREIARGDDWRSVKHVDLRIPTGPHVLAASAANDDPGPAGFLLRGGVLPLGQGVPIHTDRSWKSAETVGDGLAWTTGEYDDSNWSRAAELGLLGTGPWQGLVYESGDASGRFQTPEGFQVAMVATPEVTGSAVAFTFDPQGRPVVSIERGPIALLVDADKDGKFEERKVIASQVNNCQGLAFIRGHLYAVGNGPQKTGLYRLDDSDEDGLFEAIELVRATDGGMGEHGPHAILLGPDGCLYYNNGNHAHLKPPIDPQSPYNIPYEGEVLPHYNDSRGHAVGILAPGGEIYRSSDDGKTWERMSAGYRNHYDFAINRDGEVFTFDSDMEWDIGLPWYRPVRVIHSVSGGEFGSRNGSAAMPGYFFDTLPPTFETGRGSPTGVTFYQGRGFPQDYDDNFLACDWSQGRILAIELTRDGATYKAKEKELVSGQPLNCTDIEVGPDGAVYFTTGGRGTLGGLYRVGHEKLRKPELIEPKGGKPDLLRNALEMDSPLSAFGQRRLAQIRTEMGEEWASKLTRVAGDGEAAPADRTRALDLLAQLGPEPAEETLITLSQDKAVDVRARAVALLGMRKSEKARAALTDALGDTEPFVKRRACESLVRTRGPLPVASLLPLLGDEDRWVRWAARVAIEHAGPAEHREAILAAKGTRPLLEGMLALVRATKLDRAAQEELLTREFELLSRSPRADEVLDLTRLIGLTYLKGPRKPAETAVTSKLADQYLTLFQATLSQGGDPTFAAICREAARLLALLNEPRAVAAILKAQAAESDRPTQIHYAYCLRAFQDGWTPDGKRQFWAWLETASHWDGGFSYLGYLDFMAQDVLPRFTVEERNLLLAQGEKYPFPTRVLVRAVDLKEKPERVADLTALYARLGQSANVPAANDLRALILETLGRVDRPEAHAALRELAKLDPGRRDLVARALAQHPAADDLPVFVAALESRDPNTTGMVLNALGKLDRSPEGPEGLRNLIRLARRTGPPLQAALNALASRWTGSSPPSGGFDETLAAWERLYGQKYPDGPTLADASAGQNSYTLPQLMASVLQSDLKKTASPERGQVALAKAKCLDCHKLGDQGQGLGPDLTTVSSRFRPHEILESIVEPSKVISDQYKSITVATADGKVYNGMPTAMDGDNLVLLLSDGTKVTVPKADVEEQKESKVSVMPDGLLNALTLREIADLLAVFEAQPKVDVPMTSPKN